MSASPSPSRTNRAVRPASRFALTMQARVQRDDARRPIASLATARSDAWRSPASPSFRPRRNPTLGRSSMACSCPVVIPLAALIGCPLPYPAVCPVDCQSQKTLLATAPALSATTPPRYIGRMNVSTGPLANDSSIEPVFDDTRPPLPLPPLTDAVEQDCVMMPESPPTEPLATNLPPFAKGPAAHAFDATALPTAITMIVCRPSSNRTNAFFGCSIHR